MPIMAHSFSLVNRNVKGAKVFYITKQVAVLTPATCHLVPYSGRATWSCEVYSYLCLLPHLYPFLASGTDQEVYNIIRGGDVRGP